jgi:hypothetical protein
MLMLDRSNEGARSLADLVSAAEDLDARFVARPGGHIEYRRGKMPDERLAALQARRDDLYAYLREWYVD